MRPPGLTADGAALFSWMLPRLATADRLPPELRGPAMASAAPLVGTSDPSRVAVSSFRMTEAAAALFGGDAARAARAVAELLAVGCLVRAAHGRPGVPGVYVFAPSRRAAGSPAPRVTVESAGGCGGSGGVGDGPGALS